MNNEFYLRYNILRDYKYNNFDIYTKDIVSAYSKMDILSSSLSINETLSYSWGKILSDMDKLIQKRDSIDLWWTNYLENIRRLEQGLPDEVVAINKYSIHKFEIDRGGNNSTTIYGKTSQNTTGTSTSNRNQNITSSNTPSGSYTGSNTSSTSQSVTGTNTSSGSYTSSNTPSANQSTTVTNTSSAKTTSTAPSSTNSNISSSTTTNTSPNMANPTTASNTVTSSTTRVVNATYSNTSR